jgi:hypothetical protein
VNSEAAKGSFATDDLERRQGNLFDWAEAQSTVPTRPARRSASRRSASPRSAREPR